MKWQAFKKGGKYYSAGYVDAPADADVVEQYDGPVQAIVQEIQAGVKSPLEKRMDALEAKVQ